MTTRRRLTLADKVAILTRQAVCPMCGEPLGDRPTEWEHEIALSRGGADTNENMRAVHKQPCHKQKTFGNGATTRGSDIGEPAHERHVTATNIAFQARLLTKAAGDTPAPVRKSRIPSRPFPKRTPTRAH